jgi:hypothetical protein
METGKEGFVWADGYIQAIKDLKEPLRVRVFHSECLTEVMLVIAGGRYQPGRLPNPSTEQTTY